MTLTVFIFCTITAVPPFVITGALAYLESIAEEVCKEIDMPRLLHG